MTKKQDFVGNFGLNVSSTDDFDAIKFHVSDELESANVKCDNFTVNREYSVLDDYDAYIRGKNQEKEQKSRNLITKLLDCLLRR